MVRKNKVTQLAEQLRKLLHDSPDKMAPFKSARKTAAEFGVSRQTADRALRMLAEEGVLRILRYLCKCGRIDNSVIVEMVHHVADLNLKCRR